MIKLHKIFLTILALLYSSLTLGEFPIRLEVKAFDNNTIYILYHSREQEVKINTSGNLIKAALSIPTNFEVINPLNFNKYADTPSINSEQNLIAFNAKGEFISHSIINGEKLTAIKFRDKASNNEEDKLEEALKQISTEAINEPKADKDSVKYENIKDEHSLTFDFEGKSVGMSAFFRGKYLWIVFDKHKKFTLANNKIFQNFEQLDNDENTVLRIRVASDYNNGYVSKKGSQWSITFSKNKRDIKRNVINFKASEKGESVSILNNFNNNTVLSIYDPEIGDTLKIVPLKIAGAHVEQKYDTISFNIIPSIQGVVIAINNDDVEFTKNKDSLEIISKNVTTMPGHSPIKSSKSAELLGLIKFGTLLPIIDKKLDIADFSYNYSRLISEISQAENPQDIFSKRLEFAKFLFMHGLYSESLAVLKLSKKTTPREYNYTLHAQFLTAVNNTLQGSLQDAKDIYNDLLMEVDPIEAPEIVLWNNYNEFLIGHSNNSIGFLNNLNKSINLYPDNLYWLLALSEIEVRLFSNDLKGTEVIFKDLRTPTDTTLNSLKFYKAIYYRKKEQLNLAKQFLQELTSKDHDPFNKVRAEMELVKLELSNKEISMSDAIKRLNAVRFIWRGDKVEYDLLTLIATYYRDLGDATNALRTFKYIQSAFNNDINNFYITSEMVKIFNNVFLPGGTATDLDDFTAVALFYEFKDLNPIGAQGDEVILSIARLLMKLDLLDSAISLLRHQINYRLVGEKRIINADHLAIILLLDKKPQEAIQVLDQTDQDNFKFNEHEYRIRLKAKALIDLKKYNEAVNYLKNDSTDDARILVKESLFRAEKWQDYIALQEPELTLIGTMPVEGNIAQDILRLAIAYYMQNNQIGLENLKKNLNIASVPLKNVIDLLLTSSAPIDYKNLDKSLNINQIQTLLDKYKNQLFNL